LAAVLRSERARRRANLAGLALSSVYVGWSFVAQARADRIFTAELARQGHSILASRTQTSATPLNTFLWRHLAETPDGFLIGYWSWFDRDETVRFDFVPRRAELVEGLKTRSFAAVDWFSQGYWAAEPWPAAGATVVRVVDLRFNEVRAPGVVSADWVWPFAWSFPMTAADDSSLTQIPAEFGQRSEALKMLWQRVRGERTGW
jgi:inner membrane protein